MVNYLFIYDILDYEVIHLSLGENLKKIRTSKNITQKELAEKLGVSVRTIQNYESGNREPSIDTLYKVAAALDVKALDFLPDEEMPVNTIDYIDTKEFEHIVGANILQSILDSKNNYVIPFIKHINQKFLNGKYDIDDLLYADTKQLLNSRDSDYDDLLYILIDIIDARLNRYKRKKELLSKYEKENEK